MQMLQFNFHQKLKNYKCLRNRQMHQTLNNIWMHVKKNNKKTESDIYNIWCRLQSGQCIGVDVKIVILHVQIKVTIFKI